MNSTTILKKAGLFTVALLLVALFVDGFYPDKSLEELSRHYLSPASAFMTVDGVNVHYRDEGSGPVIVLVHGVSSSLHTWEGWVRELKSQFRVITLDMPGYGLTGPDFKERYSFEESVEFLDQFITALGLTQFTLGGNSRGGGIAWMYGLRYPEKVDKLILVDAGGMPLHQPTPFVLSMQLLPGVRELANVITPKWLVGMSVAQVFGDPAAVTENVVNRYHDLLLRTGNRDANIKVLSKTVLGLAETYPIGDLQMDTLIMWGGMDQWLPVEHAYLFHEKLPQSHLKIYPELGHIPMEEAPLTTSMDVLAFLNGGSSSTQESN